MDEFEQNDRQIVDEAIAKLHTRFDTIQVFVTRQEPSKATMAFSKGAGNWYARYGQIIEWVDNGGVMHLDVPDEEDGDE